jgi:type I restriction enzyme S subunit
MSEVPNEGRLRTIRIGDLLQRIDAGWSPLCEEVPPSPGEWGVLKVSAVTSGSYVPGESKAILPGTTPRPDIEIQDGDIIMCRANGAKNLVGSVVMTSDTPPNLMLSDKTLRLVPEPTIVKARYFFHYLTSWHVKKQIAQLFNGGTGQTNISQHSIRSIKITIPQLAEQQRIAEILDALDGKHSGRVLI